MEILTAPGRVDINPFSDGDSVLDIRQIIANSSANRPAIGGPSANSPAGEIPADWDTQASDGQNSPQEGRIGRKKKPLRFEGETGQAFAGALPKEDAAAPREGKLASRQSLSLRGAGQDIPGAFTGAEGRGRQKTAAQVDAMLPPLDKAVEPKHAEIPASAALDAGDGDANPLTDMAPAGVPLNTRPAGEFMPGQLKAPDPLLDGRQPAAPQFTEMKSHAGDRGGTLLYTFNKGNAVSLDAMTVNQVQISFQGSTLLMPSNRITQENLLANQSEARGYVVKPAFDREQQQRRQHERDGEPGEDQ